MAFGRCVLLSDIPENAEVGGEAAVYFRSGDVRKLKDAIETVLEGDSEAAERGEEGRRRIEKHFNWDRLVDSLEAFYIETMEKRHGLARQ
jgi:glycosyltransferase involved in cell wall biosynthesis